LAIVHIGCAAQQASSQAVATPSPSPSASPVAATRPAASPDLGAEEVWIGEVLSDEEELTYNGYQVQKRHRKVRIDVPAEAGGPVWGEGSYIVLKRGGKVLAKFDAGLYTPTGNATSFGMFPLLGGEAKQLIVSQDIFRGGNQWIVSLTTQPRVIYDGSEFGTGREGYDMGIVDLDKDGVYEITQPLTAFYGFSGLPPAWTPLPTVIFKYDARVRKYLPANTIFQDYLLKELSERKPHAGSPDDRINHLAEVLHVVLGHVFAGREQDAWAFYEREYRLPDKMEMKKKIKAELEDLPVYRFMYRPAAKGKA
jgi:hypothetical protein